MQKPGTPTITIADRRIGAGEPVYVIAEISANHNQSFDQAAKLVHAARDAGADAVKLQTYTPDTITLDSEKEYFRIQGTIWNGRNLHALYAEAYTPWEWQGRLMEIARDIGIHCFSSPFDDTAVDFLEDLDVPAYKIASFENVDIPLLRRVAGTGKPVIVSTGMATLAEIEEAVVTLRGAGAEQIALLKCTSAYPARPDGMNLRTIPHLGEAFHVPVGLSDHTMGVGAPVAAVALGARLIEKHITLSRDVPGPDSAFSLEPDEFTTMVQAVRSAEQALGTVSYSLTPGEEKSRSLRRSLFAVADIRAGEQFGPHNVRSIRPGHGLHTRYLDEIMGSRCSRDVEKGTPLAWDMVAG